MSKLAKLLESAMKLDPDERAILASELLDSLDELSEEERERLWLQEVARRREQVLQGRAELIPAADVHAKAQKLLK